MKLPFQIAIKCDEEELTEAQWKVIAQLRTALVKQAAQQALCEQLRGCFPSQSMRIRSPDAWVRAFSAALVAWARKRAESAYAAWEYDALQRRYERLEQQLQTYRDDPLQEQVTQLQEARDRWQEQAEQRGQHITDLQQRLSATRRRYREEAASLQHQIVQLNDIIVQQQETLRTQQT